MFYPFLLLFLLLLSPFSLEEPAFPQGFGAGGAPRQPVAAPNAPPAPVAVGQPPQPPQPPAGEGVCFQYFSFTLPPSSFPSSISVFHCFLP